MILDRNHFRLYQCPEHLLLRNCRPAVLSSRRSVAIRFSCRGLRSTSRAGNRSVNDVPRPTSLSTVIVPSSCSTIRLEIARPRPRPRRLVVTNSSKIADSRSAGMPDPVSVTVISTRSPTRAVAIDDAAARLGRLDGVRDQIAVDPPEREPVAVDGQRAVGVAAPRPRRRCARLRRASSRRFRTTSTFTSIANRSIGFGLTMLRRSSMKRLSVASSRSMVRWNISRDSPSRSSREQQPRAVADVLDRMRQVVDQPGGDPAEHRLTLLTLDVLLQLDQPVGHGVERVAQILRTRRRWRCRTRVSSSPAATAWVARFSVKIGAMNRRPNSQPDRDHTSSATAIATDQLPLERRGVGVGLARRLLDDDGPAQRLDRAPRPPAARRRRRRRTRRHGWLVVRRGDQRMAADASRLRDERLLVRIAVGDERAVRRDDQREAVLADPDAVHHPPHLFEAELADQPACRLVEPRQVDGEDRCRQLIVVDADRRHRHAVRRSTVRVGRDRTRGGPTRLVATLPPASSNSVISRNSRNCRM